MTEDHTSTRRSSWGLDANEPKENWRDLALCRQVDPEIFFPDKGGSTKEAKRVCANCEVREECLTDALSHDDRFGVRAGLSVRERRKLNIGRPRRPQRTEHIPLKPPTQHPQCGTEAGQKKHSREGENSCDACKQAGSDARRNRLETRATA